MQKYSAGFTAEHLYRNELKSVVERLLKGLSKLEIRNIIIEENVFQCRSEAAIKDMFPRVYKRTLVLDNSLRNYLIEAVRSDANALLLYAFLKTYRFPRELVYEVIHHNYQSLKQTVTEGNILAFFEQKEEQDETVRNWSDQTKYKLKQVTLKILQEAELLKRTEDGFLITPIALSAKLLQYAENNKEYNDFLTLTLND